jgi:hypothetical protein
LADDFDRASLPGDACTFVRVRARPGLPAVDRVLVTGSTAWKAAQANVVVLSETRHSSSTVD